MKRFLKPLLMLTVILATCVLLNPLKVQGTGNALTSSAVKTQLDNYMTNTYKPGDAPPSSSYRSGTFGCFGFADLLCRNIFGHNLASQKSAMELNASSNFNKIGNTLSRSAGTLSEDSLKDLFSGAMCGDIVQMDYTTYDGKDSRHTMIVYSVSSTGVVFYHAGQSKIFFGQSSGTQPLWGTTGNPLIWENLLNCLRGSDDGISLYRSVKRSGSASSTTDLANPDNYTYPTRSLTYTSPTMKGDDVKWVQAVLCQLGFTVDIDGSYGRGTVAAIKSFQTANSLASDGNCGPATRAKLLECWNAKKAGASHTHTYSPATCTAPKTCTGCGATSGSALGHSYNNGSITKVPTCTAAGVKTYTCSTCGGTKTETIAKTNTHTYSNACDASCNVCGEGRTVGAHKYTDNSDTCCNICGAYAYPGGDTLVKENGVWYHIKDRQKVKDTTLVYYGGYWFYIKDGVINYSNTLCKWNGKWYHVKNGQVVYDTTLVKYGGYWFYVKNGVVDFNATTLCYYGGYWFYVKGGQVNYSNTLCSWNGKWWHVSGGKVVYDTTLVYFGSNWYYVKNGVVNYSNTLCNWNGKWWHVNNGTVVYDTTLVNFAGKWYYVKSGVLNYNNTLCSFAGSWYHMKNGTIAYDTTLVYFAGKWYYVEDGILDFSYSGKVLFSGKYYTVKNGVKV